MSLCSRGSLPFYRHSDATRTFAQTVDLPRFLARGIQGRLGGRTNDSLGCRINGRLGDSLWRGIDGNLRGGLGSSLGSGLRSSLGGIIDS